MYGHRGAVDLGREEVALQDLHQLHLRPEVDQVQSKTGYDDVAQHEHVLRCPLDALLLDGHGITLLAACTVVVYGKDQRIDEVNGHAGYQNHRSGQSIPVGTEKLAYRVVGLGAEHHGNVH